MIIKTEHLLYNHRSYKNPLLDPVPFSRHCHNTYEILFFERGEASYIIDEKKYKLHKNDLVFIRPYKYHYIEFTKGTEYSRINIAFSEQVVKGSLLSSVPDELEVINCPQESVLWGLFSRMNYYASKLDEVDFAELLSAMLTEIVYNLRLADFDMAHIPKTLPPLLVMALEHINNNLFTIKDIKSVSSLINVSEQYLFRLFQSQLHISPHRYITTKRLMHAKALLSQGKRPTDIYNSLGFESYVSFYKQYVAAFGYSPSKETDKSKV
jgi:AraC-like DNA-binding protein